MSRLTRSVSPSRRAVLSFLGGSIGLGLLPGRPSEAAAPAGGQDNVGTDDATIRQGVPQADWDTSFFKKLSSTPSVGQYLSDPALIGAIDLHAHGNPDPYPRQWDVFEIARIDSDRGLRGFVFKNHYAETAGYACLTRKYGTPGIEVFGGLALNLTVGGVNPQAIRYMVNVPGHYGRIVWMPTHDSEHEVKSMKGGRRFVRVVQDGQLLPEVLEVLDLIAQNDLTLATGHVSPEEALLIIREAKKRGVPRIIMTHPLSGVGKMSMDQLREGTSQGAFMEVTWGYYGPTPAQRALNLDAIRQIGSDSTFISSDCGLLGGLNHADALALAAKALREAGFTEPQLARMFKQNPAQLVKLPIL